MPRLRTLKPLVRTLDTRTVTPPPKRAEPVYLTREHREWRDLVLARANYRCQAVDNGQRCTRAAPRYRLFADHRVELRDQGAALDPNNGMALCAHHHTIKTMAQRAKRLKT